MARRARATTVLLGLLTTIMVGWVLHVGASILQPLVIAFLLASMLQPIVRGLARWHIPPAVTVIVLVVGFFFGAARLGLLLQANLTAFVSATGPGPTEQVEPGVKTPSDLPKSSWEKIRKGINGRIDRSRLPPELKDFLEDSLRELNVKGLAVGLIGGGFDFTKGLVLVVVYMLFIFAEQAIFRRKILAIAGERAAEAQNVIETISRGIQRYLGVKTLVSLVTGSLAYAVLKALDIPFAPLFGILAFLLNYIPTFGSIIAAIFPTITALAEQESPWSKAVVIVVAYLAINITLGNFIEPKILGRQLNLSPLVIIISVVFWAWLWGPVGTFLAVPLTAGVQIVLANGRTTRAIAVMMSSGPPREGRGRDDPGADAEDEELGSAA
jgi:AI-2 transport protein TqsA